MYRIYFVNGVGYNDLAGEVTTKPVEDIDIVGTILRDVEGDMAAAQEFNSDLLWTGVRMGLNGASTTFDVEVDLLTRVGSGPWQQKTRTYRAVDVGYVPERDDA